MKLRMPKPVRSSCWLSRPSAPKSSKKATEGCDAVVIRGLWLAVYVTGDDSCFRLFQGWILEGTTCEKLVAKM